MGSVFYSIAHLFTHIKLSADLSIKNSQGFFIAVFIEWFKASVHRNVFNEHRPSQLYIIDS